MCVSSEVLLAVSGWEPHSHSSECTTVKTGMHTACVLHHCTLDSRLEHADADLSGQSAEPLHKYKAQECLM